MKIFQITLILIGLFVANLVFAGIHTGPIVPCGGTGQLDCNLCHLWELGSNIINFISFNLAIPAASFLFVIAGIFFLISGGDQDKIARARTIFTNTVIGLAIIFCSWLLIDTLLKTIASTSTETGIQVMFSWSYFPACN